MTGWFLLLCHLLLIFMGVPRASSKTTHNSSIIINAEGFEDHLKRLYDAYRGRLKGHEDLYLDAKLDTDLKKFKASKESEGYRHPVLQTTNAVKTEALHLKQPPYAVHIIKYESQSRDQQNQESGPRDSGPKEKPHANITGKQHNETKSQVVTKTSYLKNLWSGKKENKPEVEKPPTADIEDHAEEADTEGVDKEKSPVHPPVSDMNSNKKSNENRVQETKRLISHKTGPIVNTNDPCLRNEKEFAARPQLILLKEDSLGKLEKDPKNRLISELNRIHKKILEAWRQPSQIRKTKPGGHTSGTVRLSALSDLLDVVERLERTDLVNELAKKINENMEPSLGKQMRLDTNLVTDSRASLEALANNDLGGLFDNMEPGSALLAFKQVLADINARSGSIKAGGLYDEYKKGFCQLFLREKYPRQSLITGEADYPVDSDEKETAQSLVSKKKLEQKVEHLNATIDTEQPIKNIHYLKALDNFMKLSRENSQNGGPKPYFLPNCKSRQLVWNEVPLIRPGTSDNSKKKIKPKQKPFEVSTGNRMDRPVLEVESGDVSTEEDNNKKVSPKIIQNPQEEPFSGVELDTLVDGIKDIKGSNFFHLIEEYENQMDNLHKALKAKQRWWSEVMDKGKCTAKLNSKRESLQNTPWELAAPVQFPEVLLNQNPPAAPVNILGDMANQNPPAAPVNILADMASQMNVSPLEMAQRIVGSEKNIPDARLSMDTINPMLSQTAAAEVKGSGVNAKGPAAQIESGMNLILDKILSRLEMLQTAKCKEPVEELKNPSCCVHEPVDGAPCDINGSWESPTLGVRIKLKALSSGKSCDKPKRACCNKEKSNRRRRSCSCQDDITRFLRSCVRTSGPKDLYGVGIPLKVSLHETVPPKYHDLMENVEDWLVTGRALSVYGGPISLTFRQKGSSMMGHFVGYCRNCGCVDTIFGSWTFCRPSRDCQDITTAIVDHRDMLRRYGMDEKRKNRIKDMLYHRSKYAKMEKQRDKEEEKKLEKKPKKVSKAT